MAELNTNLVSRAKSMLDSDLVTGRPMPMPDPRKGAYGSAPGEPAKLRLANGGKASLPPSLLKRMNKGEKPVKRAIGGVGKLRKGQDKPGKFSGKGAM